MADEAHAGRVSQEWDVKSIGSADCRSTDASCCEDHWSSSQSHASAGDSLVSFGQMSAEVPTESDWKSDTDWANSVVDGAEFQLSQLRGARRTLKALRRYLRPRHVQKHILRSGDLARSSSSRSKLESAQDANETQGVASRSDFQRVQDSFRQVYRSELVHAFGPDAVVSDVCVSQDVERRFLRRLHNCNGATEDSLHIGFHGTKHRNFESIFKQGFLLPGVKGGATIANANSHGAGVYTACQGYAKLSQSFCDTASMLVCGIIDDPSSIGKLYQEAPNEKAHLQMLRIGRIARQPCLRCTSVAAVQQPIPQAAPWRLGNFVVHRQSSEVRFVGDAMVVFNTSCVVPLLQIDNMPASLYQGCWKEDDRLRKENELKGSAKQNLCALNVFWPAGGNPNVSKSVDECRLRAPTNSHERRVSRAVSCRSWKRSRQLARAIKADQTRIWQY